MVELWFNLGRLEYILFFWIWIVLNTDLLVALSANRNAEFELGSDLAVVFTLWVAENNPLVHQRVVGHLINVRKVKLVVADKSILEKAFIHHFYNNLALFEFDCFLVLRFEKDVLVPDRNSSVVDVVLRGCELALLETLDLHNWIDCVFWRHFEVFRLFDVDMNHVISTLHLTNLILALLSGDYSRVSICAAFVAGVCLFLFFFLRLYDFCWL